MASRGRGGGIELNFDGLTDCITNLVGTLILLVVLVAGLTRPAVSTRPEPPRPRPRQHDAADKSIEPLLAELNNLRVSMEQERTLLANLDDAISQIEEDIVSASAPEAGPDGASKPAGTGQP